MTISKQYVQSLLDRIAALEAELALATEYANACRGALLEEGIVPQDFDDWKRNRKTALAA